MIAVSDWKRSNAFYRDVLGAEIDQRVEWFGGYRFGKRQPNVHGPPLESTSGTGRSGRHVYFRDPDGSLLEFLSYAP